MAKQNLIRLFSALLTAFVLALPMAAMAQDPASAPDPAAAPGALTAFTVTTNADGSQDYSVTLQILAIMTSLSFIPGILMLMTSFTRIVVVLSILRQATGLQQTPSNQIIIALALFMTLFVMRPVIDQVYTAAVEPYMEESMNFQDAIATARVPIEEFMLAQTRVNDLEAFMNIANIEPIPAGERVPLTVLIPAFVTSELKTAFQIGFMLFIPFLIIDLVVASVLMAMGMMMLSPMIVSLPFKLMLFVLVDGWNLVLGTLANSFGL
ncbi:flagellar type III secretion system pore protein FliP [Echinimonas agarilytica]|uniref:Flagellar biosynthetic protein FliP n=2 Tax=Echinimonas agarilytica TaxID=1215918 RepID=A0AA41W5L6_9GAMM|nr:flagellar type III secretion system pore protein FliP [Echinimonas agarilytica]